MSETLIFAHFLFFGERCEEMSNVSELLMKNEQMSDSLKKSKILFYYVLLKVFLTKNSKK